MGLMLNASESKGGDGELQSAVTVFDDQITIVDQNESSVDQRKGSQSFRELIKTVLVKLLHNPNT